MFHLSYINYCEIHIRENETEHAQIVSMVLWRLLGNSQTNLENL